ncbi:MAG: hypothetical protein AAF449_05930 [Myxococcota bacterium]
MAKDDLSSFRISDVRRRAEVRATSPRKPQDEPPAETSVGFPGVEALLELDSVEEVADRLRPTYEKLEALSTVKDMKTRASARKAMAAYERCADLFEYLFETKSAMQGDPENSA